MDVANTAEEMITGQGGINDIPLFLFSESISYYIYLIQVFLIIFI